MNFNNVDLLEYRSYSETSESFTVEYSMKAYNNTQADDFLELQSQYFASDRASLIAPIINVTVVDYKGFTDVLI
jgi:hypothetical protein